MICWHGSCSTWVQKHRGAHASLLRRPVEQTYADCLTNTPSQPLPLTLENNGPAAAPFSAPLSRVFSFFRVDADCSRADDIGRA